MNKKKIFKVVFIILFVAFIISYAIEKTGYMNIIFKIK